MRTVKLSPEALAKREKRIAITDNLDGEHIMMCLVINETNDMVIVTNGRKTYKMIFCKKTGKHLNPYPHLLDCLVLARAQYEAVEK